VIGSSYRSVLAFGAHPDDIEVGAGGLLARLAASGAAVTMVVASIPNRFAQRIAEARAGAAKLGAKLVLRVPDGESRLEDTPMHELVAYFDRLVAEVEPELVVTHGRHDVHWDHVLVHRATVSALRRTGCDLLAYFAGPILGGHGGAFGAAFADISSTIDAKLAAIAAHASQHIDTEARREMARATGRMCGTTYAESFDVLRLRV
jgi:LmbE family N-acetylglucosaminyl deacetylase